MALTDLTRISTSGIATGSTIDSPILRKDVDFRGNEVGVTSALFDSSENELNLKDNVKLTFGNATNGDLRIYHDTSNGSYVREAGPGALRIQGDAGVWIQSSSDNQDRIVTNHNGDVQLFYSGDKKLNTTNHGVEVTGVLTATSFSGPTNNTSGISTFYDLRVSNNLTVEGTTTTLDTNLIGVDRVEIDANSNTIAGIAVTQSGTADIVNLFDGNTKVLTVKDGGSVGIGTHNPAKDFHVTGTSRFEQLDVVGFATFGSAGTRFFHHTPRIEMPGSNTATISFVNATTGTNNTDGMLMGFSSNSKAGFINVNEGSHGFVLKTGGSHASAERINISGVGTVSLRYGNTEEMVTARPNGAVELYHNGTKRLETTDTGVDIPDSLSISGEIIHTGDTDTKIEFADNQIDLKTGGYSRLYANNYAVYVQSGHPLGFLASSGPSPSIKSGGTNNQDLLLTSGTDNPTRMQIAADGKIKLITAETTDYLQYGNNPRLWLKCPNGINGMRIDADTTPLEIKNSNNNGKSFSFDGNFNFNVNGDYSLSAGEYDSSGKIFLNATRHNGSTTVTSFQTSIQAVATSNTNNTGYLGLGASAHPDDLVIKTDGKVGIGTTQPDGQLHISSGISGDCRVYIEADADNNTEGDNPFIIFKNDGGVENASVWCGNADGGNDNSLNLSAATATGGGIRFFTSTTDNGWESAPERLRITPAGLVGIGTNNPDELLHIFSESSHSKIVLEADNNSALNGMFWVDEQDSTQSEFYYSHPDNKQFLKVNGNGFEIYSKQTSKVTAKIGHGLGYNDVVVPNGNLGIGTDDPDIQLDIFKFTNTSGSTGTTMLRLTNHVGSNADNGDLHSPNGQQTFIDFRFLDANASFTPQVRIGAQIGNTGGDDGIESEGNGSFVVYTGKGTNNSGGGTLTEKLRVTPIGSLGFNKTNPTARVDFGYDSGQLNHAFMQFRGPNNKSGEMLHKYIANGASGGGTVINLFEVTSWQSTNSRIFGVVKVMACNPLSNQGYQAEGWFFKSDDGNADQSTMTKVHDKGGSVGSLSWDSDTLRYTTPNTAYLSMHVSVEYHTYDGATVVFDTSSRYL